MAAIALQNVLTEVTATPDEEVKLQEVEKEVLDLCRAAAEQSQESTLHRLGAFQLGAQEPNAELDLVFVLPQGSTAEPSQLLEKLQEALPQAIRSSARGSLHAPGMRWRVKHREVQLFLAKEGSAANPPSRAVAPSMAALYSHEVGKQILDRVPSQEAFRDLLRLVKFWAKRRGIYGSSFGFLDGTTWAVCCARVCQLHPKAAIQDLFHCFFQDLCRYDWSAPISLDVPALPMGAALVLLPGNAYGAARPANDEVSESVMRLLQRELRRAQQKTLPELWAEHRFFGRHHHYIRFDFMASSNEILEKWWAWGQQQLPELLYMFEAQLDNKVSLRPWPCSMSFKDESWSHAKAVFIGLHIQRSEQTTLDLREIMVKFLEKISAWPEAERHLNHFELMIRAVSSEEMKSWLLQQGSPLAKMLEQEVASGRLGGYTAGPVAAGA